MERINEVNTDLVIVIKLNIMIQHVVTNRGGKAERIEFYKFEISKHC